MRCRNSPSCTSKTTSFGQTQNSLVFERTVLDGKLFCLRDKAISHFVVWKQCTLTLLSPDLDHKHTLEGLAKKKGLNQWQQTSQILNVFISSSLLPLNSLSLQLLINFPTNFVNFLISNRKGGLFMLQWLSHLLKIGRQRILSANLCISWLFRVYLDSHFKLA